MDIRRSFLLLSCVVLSGCLSPAGTRIDVEAESQPLGSVRSSPKGDYYIYRIQKGDSLFSIGNRLGISPQKLIYWNQLNSPYTIYPGDALVIRKTYKKTTKFKRWVIDDVVTSPYRSKSSKKISLDEKMIHVGGGKRRNKGVDIEWSWPADGNIVEFFTIGPQPNKGIDIAGKSGDPVKSAAKGKVVYTGSGLLGYGNLVIVRHDRELLTAYGHNSRILVKEGDQVKAGQKIAEIGSSGTSGLNRLHFEIRKDGKPVNPLDYLP